MACNTGDAASGLGQCRVNLNRFILCAVCLCTGTYRAPRDRRVTRRAHSIDVECRFHSTAPTCERRSRPVFACSRTNNWPTHGLSYSTPVRARQTVRLPPFNDFLIAHCEIVTGKRFQHSPSYLILSSKFDLWLPAFCISTHGKRSQLRLWCQAGGG